MAKGKIRFVNFLKSKYAFWIVLLFIFLISRLAVWFYPFDSDHWIFYYIGKKIVSGGIPYISAWDHKPPLIFFFNAFLHLLFGNNLIWHRIFFTLLTFLDIYLFYKLAQKISKKLFLNQIEEKARIGLIFYVFFRNLSQFVSSGNNTENLGLIFLTLMFLTFLEYQESKKVYLLFGSGVCLSILFFLKGNFLLLSLPIFVELIIFNYKSFKKLIFKFALFLLPLFLQTIFWIYYFKIHNALSDFLVASFYFSSSYVKSAWLGRVSSNQLLFLAILAPLIIFLLPFFWVFLKDYKKFLRNQTYRFLFVALLSSIVFGLAIGSFYAYYFLILFPTFFLIIIYGFNILNPLEYDSKEKEKKSYIKNLIIVLALILGMGCSWLISMKQFYNFFKGPVREDLEEYRQIADYIKSNSEQNDTIEAYIYGAVLYRLAERDAGSRFISASVLLLDERENYGFNFSPTFIADLEKSRPKFWVIAKNKENLYYQNKEIINYMEKNFVLDKTFSHYLVLKNKKSNCH